MFGMIPESERGDALQKLGAATPLGRIGLPEDIANAVYFLSVDMSSFITGEALGVAGGFRSESTLKGDFMGIREQGKK
jgi:NAD(P)-dependent dehydrogenase (short-subunit alcohol dehydrogenase family)